MSMKYDGKDSYRGINITIVALSKFRKKDSKREFDVIYNLMVGGLTVALCQEDAVKLWHDLSSKIEEVSDPNFQEKILEKMRKNGVFFD